MCIATLHAIEKCSAPPPGISSLALIDPDDLNKQPVWYRTPSIDSLDFKSGKAAYIFEADRLTARITSRTSIADISGDRVDYLLQARVSGISAEVDLLRQKLLNRRVHVAATYQSGLQRFLPWMRLSADGDSGDRSNRNAYSFSGSLRLSRITPFLQAEFNLIGGPYVPPDPGSGSSGGITVIPITTTDSDYTYQVPAGKLLAYVWIVSDEAQVVSLGTTASGAELGGPVPLDADQAGILGSGLLRPTSNTNVYLSGLAGTNSIEIWLLSAS